MFPLVPIKSSQSACGQRVLRAPQVLHVLVADGHKPADDGRRVARAALQQRKLRGACGARRTFSLASGRGNFSWERRGSIFK